MCPLVSPELPSSQDGHLCEFHFVAVESMDGMYLAGEGIVEDGVLLLPQDTSQVYNTRSIPWSAAAPPLGSW